MSTTMVLLAWIYVHVLLSLVVISTVRGAMVCQHKDDIEHAVHGVYLEPHEHIHVAKRSSNQPARFSVYYDMSIYQLTLDQQNTVKTIMQQLNTFLSQTLQLKPLGVPLLLDQQCATPLGFFINGIQYCATTCVPTTKCGEVVVPASHLQACRQCNGVSSSCSQTGSAGAGVSNIDYLFYVSAISATSCGTNILAFASYCQTESSLDRPIAGNINLCPLAFSSSNNDIMSIVQHEALHALGFSGSLFALWRDQNGNPRTPRDPNTKLPPVVNGAFKASTSTVMPLTYDNWVVSAGTISHPVTLLVTPNVLSAAQLYFNCPSLIGVELENQGGDLTAGQHWEKRILGNELMTGEQSFNPRFSVLTLAALQDTGWYQVNYSMAQPLAWGQNAGCLFATGSCGGYMASKLASGISIDPFCNHYSAEVDMLGCTIDRAAVSYCNLMRYESALPTDYQYFSSLGSNFGGRVFLADYCPFQYIFDNQICSNADNNPFGINYFAETYGPGSACVLQGTVGWSVNNTNATNIPAGAGCYQYSYINNSLAIGVLGTSYPCPTANQQINVNVTVSSYMYTGSLQCATYNQLSGGSITNDCSTNNGGCSQICTNTPGSFMCSCTDGYALGDDNKICHSAELSGGKIAGVFIGGALTATIVIAVIIYFMYPLLSVNKKGRYDPSKRSENSNVV